MLMVRFHHFSAVLAKYDSLNLTGEVLKTAMETIWMLARRVRDQATLDTAQDILTITDRLEERRNLGASVEQIYELASIWYFSENENPGVPEMEINAEKIRLWLKYPDLYHFFLNVPLGDWLPLAMLSPESTRNCLRAIKDQGEDELLDLSILWRRWSIAGETSETIESIRSRTETLSGYDGLLSVLLNNTTTTSQPGGEPSSEN